MENHINGLDVHFEIRPNTPKEWTERSFYGLRQAIEQVDFPVHVYVVKGLPGLTGTFCGGGYTCGKSIYATHTAVEEYILPNAFVELEQRLFHPDSQCSLSEYAIRNARMLRSLKGDLLVVRREQLLDRHHPYGAPYYSNHRARWVSNPLS
jgi:hypothetical protein